MLKKLFLTAAIAMCSLTCAAAPADGEVSKDAMNQAEVVAERPDGQADVQGDWVNSTEVNTVEESSTGRKMSQAEKARNAAENDEYGGVITIIAMCIVLSALIVLSILFLGFGKVSSAILSKKKLESHGISKDEAGDDHDLDSGEVIAAIALAISEHLDQRHDIENTILTLRRMRKAYSPWNSKIYNMRHMPEHNRNVQPSGRLARR